MVLQTRTRPMTQRDLWILVAGDDLRKEASSIVGLPSMGYIMQYTALVLRGQTVYF